MRRNYRGQLNKLSEARKRHQKLKRLKKKTLQPIIENAKDKSNK